MGKLALIMVGSRRVYSAEIERARDLGKDAIMNSLVFFLLKQTRSRAGGQC